MDELCPLCLKMGINRRIKAVQINLDEAIWLCENEECPWPFGHETPNFLSRKVGEKWSGEWEIYKKVQKRVGPIPVSKELSLYTPPVTPSGDATSKETAKSDFSSDPSISERINEIGSILTGNLTPDDLYAPKSCYYNGYTSNELRDDRPVPNTDVRNETLQWIGDSRIHTTPSLPSIFDIDDELSSNKIIIKDSPKHTKKSDQQSTISKISDVIDSPKPIDTVLNASVNEKIPLESFVAVKREEIMESTVPMDQKNNSTKAMPQIRSISRTNINFQKLKCPKTAKNEQIAFEKSLNHKQTESDITMFGPKKIEGAGTPTEGTPTRDESAISSEKKLFNGAQSPRRTTVITVNGSLPITLSYDLTDLEEISNDQNISVTSTPNHGRNNKNSGNIGSSVELPKKSIRPSAKRRAASIGKRYEKFSFNALKKFVPASEDGQDRPGNPIMSLTKDARGGSEKTTIPKNEMPSVPRLDLSEKIADSCELSNNFPESLNSANTDSANSEITSHFPIAENLNLSGVLDDILMEGYQNATASLNDDWLESFFT